MRSDSLGGRGVSPGARQLMMRAWRQPGGPPPATAGSVGALLREGVGRLEAAGLPRARQDAEWLLAWLAGVPRWRLTLEPDHPVAEEVSERFRELVDRRRRWEPLQYLLGWEDFRGLRLRVTPAVLVPRPETELLVEWALELLSELSAGAYKAGVAQPGGPPLIIDLGTGSGAIALALAVANPDLTVYAVDQAPEALALARENVAALGMAARVLLFQGDLFDPLGLLAGAVDLVISNPHYIPSATIPALPREVREYEPIEALDGGPDGMSVHRKIIAETPRFLRPGGWLLLEMGEGHSDHLSQLLEAVGFTDVQVRKDLSGVERMIGARLVGLGPAADGGRGAARGPAADVGREINAQEVKANGGAA